MAAPSITGFIMDETMLRLFLALIGGGELGAFAHGALGVQLARLARAADVMEAIVAPAAGLLPGTYDDGIRGNDHRRAVGQNVKTRIVDAAVFDALQHPDTVTRQLGAVHPAGGASERLAERPGRALEHGDAVPESVGRRVGHRSVRTDAPMLGEGVRIECRPARALHEVQRDIEADAAHADNRHIAAGLDAA